MSAVWLQCVDCELVVSGCTLIGLKHVNKLQQLPLDTT